MIDIYLKLPLKILTIFIGGSYVHLIYLKLIFNQKKFFHQGNYDIKNHINHSYRSIHHVESFFNKNTLNR